jgi:hypothetical protein
MEPQMKQNTSAGTLTNGLNLNFDLVNRSETLVSIEKVKVEYQAPNTPQDQWTPVNDIYLGQRYAPYDYSFGNCPFLNPDKSIKVKGQSIVPLTVRAWIEFKGRALDGTLKRYIFLY